MNAVRQNNLEGSTLPSVRCNRCHKPLKVPESVLRGFGPICWGRIQAWNRKEEAEAEDKLAVRLREEIDTG